MSMITLTIDGQTARAEQGATILEAAGQAGIKIPTLCYMKGINEISVCRICVVEVVGAGALQPACVTPVAEGMEVYTQSPVVRRSRRTTMELILSDHPYRCPTCVRDQNCELQNLVKDLDLDMYHTVYARPDFPFNGAMSVNEPDDSSYSLVRDPAKCVLCQRCVAVCEKVQSVSAITLKNKSFEAVIGPVGVEKLGDSKCVNCGQCVLVCPTGALLERDHFEVVKEALADPKKHVVVQTAPSVRVAIGEAFGMEPGSVQTGQMVAALRRLGFDKVFDTDFAADLTIMEEGSELLERIDKGGPLPLITSCSPGWIKFAEQSYPQLLPNLSTCKSPQQMFGAIAKTYYAGKAGIDPKDMFVVSIMPCTAKKFEARRPEMNASGYRDVDAVLTTRELGRMLKQAEIDLGSLPQEKFDDPLGVSTGAAVIFGATGGVSEAALRTAYELMTKKTLKKVEFTQFRGLKGIKEATVKVGDMELKIAVVSGLGNARKLLDYVVERKAQYHMIEIMACPGGCAGGGGQPYPTNINVREKRIAGIYKNDEDLPIRKSHENPAIKQLYADYLDKPLSKKSHELLHTHYTPRG